MSEKLSEIWQDPAEAVGELLIEKKVKEFSPLLAQMPLLSTTIAAYKSIGAIGDYLLARKVQQFYTAWEDLDKKDRQKVYEKFQKKPKAFIEKLLFILTQQEDLQKCRLLGTLTTAYLQGKLRRGNYLDLIETVHALTLSDLRQLHKLFDRGVIVPQRLIGERYAALFVSRGLLATEPSLPQEQRASESPFYRITALGARFVGQLHESNLELS